MADVANFRLAPALRCGERFDDSRPRWCARLATHVRFGVSDFPEGYFCPLHSKPGDRRIPESFLFRRVSVQLEVSVAGVCLLPAEAEREAVDVLRRALEHAGGLVNLHTVHSALGRYSPPVQEKRGPKAPGAP